MKTALILTGKHNVTDEKYQGIIKAFEDSGWDKVILYEPNWDKHTVKELVDDFTNFVPVDSQPLTLLGFSLGAMIALIASGTLDVDNLLLCSPSGYFREYEPLLTADDLNFARKHLNDFKSYSAVDMINKTKAKRGHIIAGEKELAEWPDFKKWVDDLKLQTGWDYTELADVGHEIEAVGYQEAITSLLARRLSDAIANL